jgi:uncharacterized membrane protein YfcA
MDFLLALPLPDGFLLLVALAGLGSFVYGVAGFGSALVAVPLALHAHPASLVLAVYALLDLVNVGRVLWAQPVPALVAPALRAELVRLLPGCALGLVVGTLLLSVIAPRPLMALLGAFVTGYALWSLRTAGAVTVLGRHWGLPAGVCSGLTSSMFGIGGPPYVIYLMRRALEPDALRVAIAMASLVSVGGRALAFGLSGLLDAPAVWWTVLVALPVSLLSLALAERLRRHLSPTATRHVIEALLLLSGLSLLAKAAWAPPLG